MNTDALLDKRPRLRPDLLMSRELRRGPVAVVLVKDRRSGRAFELAAKERFVLSRLDGDRSLADIGAEYAHEFGRRLGPQHWSRLLWLLHERDLLQPAGAAAVAGPTLTAADRLIDRWARPLRRPGWRIPAVAVVALFVALAADLPGLWRAAARLADRPWTIAPVLAVLWLSAALHEFAHGVAARRYGCTVRRINLLTLTCTVEDYLYLPARTGQVAIAAAGALANGLVLLPFGLAWFVVGDGPAATVLAAVLLAGAAQTLVNFVPLPPLDGYKMLGHALGLLDLAAESRRFLRGLPRGSIRRYPTGTAVWLTVYGLTWLALVGAVAGAVGYGGGRLLAGPLGPAGYVVSAAVVALTFTGWSARPARRKPVNRSEDLS